MTIPQTAVRYGQRRVMRRVGRMLPWVGVAFALAGVASAVRRKGFIRGSVDSALNAIPIIGGVKTAAELVRGRDFIAAKMPT
jgi:hypothetical protein